MEKLDIIKRKYALLSDEFIDYLFIDGNQINGPQYHNVFQAFEQEENGYFKSCRKAFDFVLPLIRVDANKVLEIHRLALDGVKNTNYQTIIDYEDKEGSSNLPGTIRTVPVMIPITFGSNFSEEGFNNLTSMKKCQLIELSDCVEDLTLYNRENYASQFSDYKYYIIITKNKSRGLFIPNFPKNKTENHQDPAAIKNEMELILNNYYDSIASCIGLWQILSLICQTIQDLEQLHPFLDGNCRTFCMILLNKFLIDQKLSPIIQDDPNKFDGYSLPQIIHEVINSLLISNKFLDSSHFFLKNQFNNSLFNLL
jgi:hypothetical protein